MKIEIKCRFSGAVLFAHDAEKNSLRITLEAAVSARANLAGAYLAGAYLAGANLAGAYLDGEVLTKSPLSLLNLKWSVLITARYMRIGCQRHSHADWEVFDDETIAEMASGAIDFWRKWKGPLMALCAEYREEMAEAKQEAA